MCRKNVVDVVSKLASDSDESAVALRSAASDAAERRASRAGLRYLG